MLPFVIGWLCGVVALFDDADTAVGNLNRFALYVPFPALILASLARDPGALPHSWAFWLVVPATVLLALLPLKWVGDRLDRSGGTLALVVVFGNTAYLGLPFVVAMRGEAVTSTVSLLVGIYVFLSMLLGPFLLTAWSGQTGAAPWRGALATIVRQPLTWSPILGVAARWLPDAVRGGIVGVLAPLGQAAGPVALFLLGMYVHTHARRLERLDVATVAHLAAKMAWLPLVTTLGLAVARPCGLGVEAARCILLLACMPPAITTFAIARDANIGADRVAQVIVAGTLLSAVTLPLAAVWVASWAG